MTVGEKIRVVRKEKGLSQKDLAEKLNIATGTLQQYELGKRKVTVEKLMDIAFELEVSVGRLIPFNKSCLASESQKRKCQTIADHYGFIKQSMMMIEECSELQKAICKWNRERGDLLRSESSDCDERAAIIDELADVIIMANQISYLLSAEDEVSEQIEFKLDRQMRRMEEENVDQNTKQDVCM